MNTGIVATMLLGFVLGFKHALDADHLIAVSTIVGKHRSILHSSLVGTFWGLGHTASLLVAGTVVLLLRVSIPPRTALWMEMAVAVMLVYLGILTIRQALRTLREAPLKLHSHVHTHGNEIVHSHMHLHAGQETHEHKHLLHSFGIKPFLIGTVHGMAGSAALMLLVLTTIPTLGVGLLYIAVFGIGSVGGMLVMSALISVPFLATAKYFSSANGAVRMAAGLLSVVFGLGLGSELIIQMHKLTR